MIFSNNLISTKSEFIDGVLTDFHDLGYFGKKSAIKRIKSLQEKFSFLIQTFEYNYSFIDVPGFNGIVVICYEKNNSPDISVCLERGCCELLINIDGENISVPLLYYVYNHEKPIRVQIDGNDLYIDDYTRYLSFLLKNIHSLSISEYRNFYKKNPAFEIKWLDSEQFQ